MPLTKDKNDINYEDLTVLSTRVRTFIGEYCSNGNDLLKAVRAAGFTGKDKDLEEIGRCLKSSSRVQKAIQQGAAELLERLDITRGRILNELACIAFFDVGDLYDEFGNMLPVWKLPVRARRAISAVSSGLAASAGLTQSYGFVKKEKALELLGKYLGMFNDVNVKHTGDVNVRVQKVEEFDIEERTKQIKEQCKVLEIVK